MSVNDRVTSATNASGVYEAHPSRVSELASQYYGNVNSTYSLLRKITEDRLGHAISGPVEAIDLLIMLASDDGQRMTSTELRDRLIDTEI